MRRIIAAAVAVLALSGCVSGSVEYPCFTDPEKTCRAGVDSDDRAPEPSSITPTDAPG